MTALGSGQAARLIPGSSPRSPLPGSPETPGALSTHLPHGGACGGLRFSDRGPSLQRLGGSQWSITQLAISKMVFRELIFGESA